jgi:hypothetical protein
MKQTLRWILATLMFGQAAALFAGRRHIQPAADLAYNPASPTASLDDRVASWQALSFGGLKSKGYAERAGLSLKESQQRRYMVNANAQDALELFDSSDSFHRRSVLWASVGPGAGAVVGLIAGGVVGSQQPNNVPLGGLFTLIGGAIVGAVGGAALGAVAGFPVALWDKHQSSKLHAQALDRFNKKLLMDLNFSAAPLPGGGAMGVSGKF